MCYIPGRMNLQKVICKLLDGLAINIDGVFI
jgi:hypothetical protein